MRISVCLFLSAVMLQSQHARAADDAVGPSASEVRAVIDKGIAYLKSRQGADGSLSPKVAGPGVTGLVAAAVLKCGAGTEAPLVAKALAYLEKNVKPDGGIYDKGLANYTTSVALMALTEASAIDKGKYHAVIANAVKFLKSLQQSDEKDEAQFGGVGYDGGKRPDLSNTQMFLEALQAAGVPKNDPAVQKAIQFIGRCQNLPGETNPLPFAKKTSPEDRGGLTYVPLDKDDNPHKTPNGGLRSLGAMTYAGLKSFLYAGVAKDDPRVQGAVAWMRAHYTLDENPGMGKAGLFYYYHTFAKALTAWGEDRFEDKSGVKHDWRKELFEAIKKRQRDDGSWINEGDRAFGESNPELSTAFALLALSYCKK